MLRLACVSAPRLRLQLLLRREPSWAKAPTAVIEKRSPLAPVLEVNRPARRRGVTPGLRYQAALSLCASLRADTVPPAEIEAAQTRLIALLRRFSPTIEPSAKVSGLFWLGLQGLGSLNPRGPAPWAAAIARTLWAEEGIRVAICCGYHRFGTCALARTGRGERVLQDPDEERRLAEEVRLTELALPPGEVQALGKLGVHRIGDLLRLPPGGVAARFGPELLELRRLAAASGEDPLQPVPERLPLEAHVDLPEPEGRVAGLLAALRPALPPLIARLGARGELARAMQVDLELEGGSVESERVCPAAPTRCVEELLELLQLRLERRRLQEGVEGIRIELEGAKAPRVARGLFAEAWGRDLRAASRALARVRADLGEEAVVRAELRPEHLPKARFAWVPCVEVALAASRQEGPRERRTTQATAFNAVTASVPVPATATATAAASVAVTAPVTAPAPVTAEDAPRPRKRNHQKIVRRFLVVRVDLCEGLRPFRRLPWLPGGAPVARFGPYLVSGGWWRAPVDRAYWFLEDLDGQIAWVYRDHLDGGWCYVGAVM